MEEQDLTSLQGIVIKRSCTIFFAFLALLTTAKPALLAFTASIHLLIITPYSSRDSINLYAKQSIQKHYLGYGIYIPFNDIILPLGNDIADGKMKNLEMVCGRGNAFVWVPFRFTIPTLGEKVYEWCLTMK